MVAYLEKSDDNTEFHQIVYFFSLGCINYALTQIYAIVDGKAVVISESLVRSDLLFDDEDGGGDRVEWAITTYTSLEAAYASDNILKTQTTTMPNVNIPQGMDTGDSPRRQDTMGGTSAQTRSERVLEQPNEPPFTEGHTSRSGEGRMEHTVKLTDTIPPTLYDSPLIGGYTPGSDEGRLKLKELIDLCTTLSNRVSTLENDLLSTKAVYHKAFITLTKRVKKLEGKMIEELDKDKDVNLVSQQGEVQEIVEPSKDDDDATHAETLLNIKRSTTKDKGKGIMQEIELLKKL
nr:hypothetical protein [Tanacetum cinerariifolium]